MKARISKKGAKILADHRHADALINAIIQYGVQLMEGQVIPYTYKDGQEEKSSSVKIVSATSLNA